MSRLVWAAVGERYYEAGVDRGVLYVPNQAGVPWNGLVSVTEAPSGGKTRSHYIDGVQYINVSSIEEFGAVIEAYSSPAEFAECDGTSQIYSGFFVTQQRRRPFGMSYRTRIGNDVQGVDHGYKVHLIYNALAAPSSRSRNTLSDSVTPSLFSWEITATPVKTTGHRRTAHAILDSRTINPATLENIESLLYGSEDNLPRLPSMEELLAIFETDNSITVVDNGNGTFTASGSDAAVQMISDTQFRITAPSAVFIDEETYTLTSST